MNIHTRAEQLLSTLWPKEVRYYTDANLAAIEAALRAERDATIEACAVEADNYLTRNMMTTMGQRIAAAIRQMKEQP